MTDQERIKELEAQVKRLENKAVSYEVKIDAYEMDGSAKMFYALNRKESELADMLNQQTLSTLNLDDPKNKTFERLKVAWGEAATIATAKSQLRAIAGISDDEEKDTQTPKYRVVTTPESIADGIGELAGKKN